MLLRPFGAMNGCCGIRGDGMLRGTAGAPRNAGTEFASGPSGIAVGGTSAVAARARTMTMKTSVQRIRHPGTARGARRQFPPCREGDDRRHGTVAHGIAGHAAGAGVLGSVGSAGPRRAGGTMRFGAPSLRDEEVNENRCLRDRSSVSLSAVVWISTGPATVVVVLDVVVGVNVVLVVVVPPAGTLDGSAGSLPASSSSRSKKPSPSRSTPMRCPEPGGTQV